MQVVPRIRLSANEYAQVMRTRQEENVLVIGDTHFPFVKEGYVKFLKEMYDKHNCTHVVHIGDIIDNHYSSFHEQDPDGMSAGDELKAIRVGILELATYFPNMKVCTGNHDAIPDRKAFKHGLSKRWIKSMKDIMLEDGLPVEGWEFAEDFLINGVLYTHGIGRKARQRGQKDIINVVQGHYHSESYIEHYVGRKTKIWVMQVGCVDGETEFLTPEGWKKISEYQDGDKVCQFDSESEIASFVEPEAYIKQPQAEMYHIENKYGLSQKLSGVHDVLYKTRGGNYKKIKMADLYAKHNSNINGFENRLPSEFILGANLTDSKIKLTDYELRVQVMFHADGSICSRSKNRGIVTVKKSRKIDRARYLLASAGIGFTESKYGDGSVRFRFTPPIKSKTFGSDWYSLSGDQLEVVSAELLLWDGDQEKRFSSKHKSDIDFAQFAFQSVGFRTSVRHDDRPNKSCWDVTISRKKKGRIIAQNGGENISIAPSSDGFEYCFTVPSGNLVLRHNDSVFVTGNCGIDDKAYAFAYGKHFNKSHINCGIVKESGNLPVLEYMNLKKEY